MTRTLSVALALAFLCACGGPSGVTTDTQQAVSQVLTEQPRPEPPRSIAPFAGSYALEGEPYVDGCNGEIQLLAHGLEIDANARSLRADVVDRPYEARMEGEQLVAEGRLDVPSSQCQNATVFERWELHRAQIVGLEGYLYSTWLIWPSCMRVCTVQFALRAQPQGGLGAIGQ
jgi:hypothetical protein